MSDVVFFAAIFVCLDFLLSSFNQVFDEEEEFEEENEDQISDDETENDVVQVDNSAHCSHEGSPQIPRNVCEQHLGKVMKDNAYCLPATVYCMVLASVHLCVCVHAYVRTHVSTASHDHTTDCSSQE